MKMHELPLATFKDRKRVGRGIGSGYGKTAGRGTKGQNARTGVKLRAGFAGGQLPLSQRLPKLGGFTSRRPRTQVIYTGQLNQFATEKGVVNHEVLARAGLIESSARKVKLIVRGELSSAVKLEIHAASKAAAELVRKAGGQLTFLKDTPRPKKSKQKDPS